MYRHNQLKEELDKLRDENDYFKLQIRYLNEKCARRDLEIRNLQLQLQIKDMSAHLDSLIKPQPIKIGLDASTSKDKQAYTTSEIVNNKELFKEFYQNIWQIPEDMIDEVFNNTIFNNKKGKSE